MGYTSKIKINDEQDKENISARKTLRIISRPLPILKEPEQPLALLKKAVQYNARECDKNCMKDGFDENGELIYRVVLFGRSGSGRKTYAKNLVAYLNLMFIDANEIFNEEIFGFDKLNRQLRKAYAGNSQYDQAKALGRLIRRRLLKPDALKSGWVLINYPSCRYEYEELFTNFETPPNKFVVLSCDETIAAQRATSTSNCGISQISAALLKKNYKMIVALIQQRSEYIRVNTDYNLEETKLRLLTKVMYNGGYHE